MIKNGQIDTFTHFSQFGSVEEFNVHMKGWLQEFGHIFTKSERIGLVYLTRYAVKVVGVANVKIGTVLKTINGEYGGNGISRSTWKRMIGKARKVGMVATYELVREKGGQSSNLYVFRRYPKLVSSQFEPPKLEKLDHHNKTSNLKTNIILNNREDELDHTYTSDKVPTPFVKLVKVFYDSCKMIEEFWRMVKIAAYKFVYEKDRALMLEIAIGAFKQTIRKVKQGGVNKPVAYFYTVVFNKFEEAFQRDLDEIALSDEEGTLYPNGRRILSFCEAL